MQVKYIFRIKLSLTTKISSKLVKMREGKNINEHHAKAIKEFITYYFYKEF